MTHPHRSRSALPLGRGLVLFLVWLACAPGALAQRMDKEVSKACKEYEKAIKKEDLGNLRQMCDVLAYSGEPGVVAVLVEGLTDLSDAEEKVFKKLTPLQKQRDRLDDQMLSAQKRSEEAAAKQMEKLDRESTQLNRKMLPFHEALVRLDKSRRASLDALAELLKGLATEQREEQLTVLLEQCAKADSTASRLALLEAIAAGGNPRQVAAAIEQAVKDTEADEDFQVQTLDALARRKAKGAAAYAIQALEHASWFVRAAAVSALVELGDLEAVPALVEALGREDGRLEGDILKVLGALTGQSFQDNADVWRRWWTTQSAKLEEILAALQGDQAVAYARAMDEAADLGFLLAARMVLQDLELLPGGDGEGIPASADTSGGGGTRTPGGAAAGGFESEESQRSTACEAVGRTVRSAHRELREQAVLDLLIEPLIQEQDEDKRRELLQIVIDVQTDGSFRVLSRIALGARHYGSFTEEDQQRALEGMGAGLHNGAVPHLGDILKRTARPEQAQTCVDILQRIDSKKAVEVLVEMADLLAERENLAERLGKDLVQAVDAALTAMTGREPSRRETWGEWWVTVRRGFQTKREAALAANQEAIPDDDGGTNAVFYGIKTRSKRLCYVLDVSGSMNEMAAADVYEQRNQTKMQVAKTELLQSISGLPDDAWFTVIFYSSGFKMWKPRLVQATPEVRAEARAWVEEVLAGGATNIFDPLSKAFELAGRGAFDRGYEVALDTIFFLSDGQPTTGLIMDPRRILDELLRLNQLKRVEVNTIGVGPGHDAWFMEQLAEQTGGVYIAR